MLTFSIEINILLSTAGESAGFWFGGTSNKISYMNCSQLQYSQWRRQNFGLGDIQQKFTQQKLLKTFKILKNLYKILTKF